MRPFRRDSSPPIVPDLSARILSQLNLEPIQENWKDVLVWGQLTLEIHCQSLNQ